MTWGYLKDVILSKLDLGEEEANTIGYFNRFAYYANEAMTQICSTVKPKHTFYEVTITDDQVGKLQTMPDDFVAFGDDRCVVKTEATKIYDVELDNWRTLDPRYGECKKGFHVLHDEDFTYFGYNQFIPHFAGDYRISYNARWLEFEEYGDQSTLNAPRDVLDCIPSYVASQCLKVDDEYKSAVFRNEYEMFLARVDDTDYKDTKTFVIGGDW